MLFLALAMALVYANRTLLIDTHITRTQVQAAQAFEAAEAGIEWATALLNDPHRLDDACRATSLSSAQSLRDRWLEVDVASGAFMPRTWLDGSVARPLRSACVRDGAGWQCSCPTTGIPHPPLSDEKVQRPSFTVSLQAGELPGTTQVNATGCNNRGSACMPGSGEPTEGKSQVQTLLALLPALFAPPAVPLTARGDVVSTGLSLALTNTDLRSGALTVDSGGVFHVPNARLTSGPGTVLALSIVEGDSALRALTADALFARHFGMDKPTWRMRPGIVRIACEKSCGAQIDAALSSGASLLWIDGDLAIDGPAIWGTPDRPVIVIATGEIRIAGAATIAGVVYGHGVAWDDAIPGTATLRGALISESGYHGSGSPELIHDPAILRELNVIAGTLVRVPGSWKDF